MNQNIFTWDTDQDKKVFSNCYYVLNLHKFKCEVTVNNVYIILLYSFLNLHYKFVYFIDLVTIFIIILYGYSSCAVDPFDPWVQTVFCILLSCLLKFGNIFNNPIFLNFEYFSHSPIYANLSGINQVVVVISYKIQNLFLLIEKFEYLLNLFHI